MLFSEKRNLTRWIIIMTSFVIVTLIMWNTYTFFQIFKEEERVKIELWAESLKTFNNADPTTDEIELPRLIMSNNKTIPIILTENGVIDDNHCNFISINYVYTGLFTLEIMKYLQRSSKG